MFFSDDLLTTKNGSFGVIWLAATLGARTKRITRKDLSTVDLSRTCELIAEPPEPMALRLSGCLLVGVARVYNQNYEIFYTDVNQFHTAIRRSFATEFSAAGNTGGQTAGVDLIGDGKSRFDAITFSGVGVGQELGFNFDFGFDYINWIDPLGKRKRRRNTSKLDSLPSQQERDEDESSEEESDEGETDDGSELPKRRGKRSKVDSSPLIGPVKDTTLRRTTLNRQSELLADAFDRDLDFPGDQPIDLGLLDNLGDTSISGPSGRGFELPEDGMLDINMDLDFGGPNPLDALRVGEELEGLQWPLNPHKEDGKQGDNNRQSRPGSAEPQEEVMAGETAQRATKLKKDKTVAIEEYREIDSCNITPGGYRALMLNHHTAYKKREANNEIAARADNLIGSGGLLVTGIDEELQELLGQAFRSNTTQWGAALTGSRGGKAFASAAQEAQPGADVDMQDLQLDQGDVFGENVMDLGEVGTCDDFTQGGPGLERLMPREGSEMPEGMRRASQQSSQGNFPDVAFGHGDDDLPAGFEVSFSTRSLRLSIMTPQELRIRNRSGQGSSSRFGRRARSRSASGSILGRHDANPAMLIGGEDDLDLELPPDEIHLDITESQAEQRTDLPEAFKPALLAGLETSCRDFLSYIEREMLVQSAESLQLDDIAPTITSKRVGAAAFYNCLTLATKGMLSVTQNEAFGPITIDLAA